MKHRLVFLPVLLWASAALQAHNPDTSYLHCQVEPHVLNLRFTFDPATLHRIVRPDTDGDGKITRAEMEAVTNDVFDYLEASVNLEINGEPAKLGERAGLGWPAASGDAIPEKEYGSALLHFSFKCSSRALIEDVYFLYDVFPELGDSHRVMADFEQSGKHLEVIFTLFEPDYVYDTFLLPDRREPFRNMVAAVWGSWWLVAVLLPPFLLAMMRRSRVVVSLAAIPGVVWLLWHWRGEMRAESWVMPLAGIVTSAILGMLCLLPLLLFVTSITRKEC